MLRKDPVQTWASVFRQINSSHQHEFFPRGFFRRSGSVRRRCTRFRRSTPRGPAHPGRFRFFVFHSHSIFVLLFVLSVFKLFLQQTPETGVADQQSPDSVRNAPGRRAIRVPDETTAAAAADFYFLNQSSVLLSGGSYSGGIGAGIRNRPFSRFHSNSWCVFARPMCLFLIFRM